MKLIINDFNKLTEEEQEDIQDVISGYTTNYDIIYTCDICKQDTDKLQKIKTYKSIISVCELCIKKTNGRTI